MGDIITEISIDLPCSTGNVFLNIGHISALVLNHSKTILYVHMISGTIFTVNGTEVERDMLFRQWREYNSNYGVTQ